MSEGMSLREVRDLLREVQAHVDDINAGVSDGQDLADALGSPRESVPGPSHRRTAVSLFDWMLLIVAAVGYIGAVVMYRWARESLATSRELAEALYYCQTYGRHSYTPEDLKRYLADPDVGGQQ